MLRSMANAGIPETKVIGQTPNTSPLQRASEIKARHSCRCAHMHLVAPYCAIPRDYLSDTPLLRAMGFFVSQHGQLGAIPPPPFLSVSPLRSMQSGGAIPPPSKGHLSDTYATPYENKANGCDTPLCDTISKGYCARWGGISHWAA